MPKNVVEEIQEDPTGVRAIWDRGNMNGAAQKVRIICFSLILASILVGVVGSFLRWRHGDYITENKLSSGF